MVALLRYNRRVMSTAHAPVFYELAEVAEMLGRSEMRVRQLVASGQLPAAKVGGRLRVPVAAFEAWLADVNRRALSSLDISLTGRTPS